MAKYRQFCTLNTANENMFIGFKTCLIFGTFYQLFMIFNLATLKSKYKLNLVPISSKKKRTIFETKVSTYRFYWFITEHF